MSRSARGARHLARVFRHVGHPSYLTFFHVSHVAPRVQTTRALAVSGVSARHVAHVAHVENSTCARRLEHHVGHVAAHIPPHSVPSKSPFWRGAPFSPPPISSHMSAEACRTRADTWDTWELAFSSNAFSLSRACAPSCGSKMSMLKRCAASLVRSPCFGSAVATCVVLLLGTFLFVACLPGRQMVEHFCCSASSLVHPLVTIACIPTLQLFHEPLRGRCLDTVYTIDLVEAPCERTHV